MSIVLSDRNRLFGVLALKVNLISQDQLLAAFEELSSSTKANSDPDLMREHLARTGVDKRVLHAIDTIVDAQLGTSGLTLKNRDRRNDSKDFSLADELSGIDDQSIENLAGRNQEALTVSLSLGQSTTDGRFQILRPHAKGGLGEVYVALDQELDRQVALKQIRGDSIPVEKRERFVREAEITGKLEHPGIVPVYGMGTDEHGNPYYAMRLIRGQSLRDAIKRYHKLNQEPNRDKSEKNKEFRRLLNCFVDVCNAISYAHSRGVLHRDLKPSNVMMGRFGETNVVDWGIA